jgi:hypothetical protein
MLAAGLEFLVSIDFFAMADTGAPHGVDEVGAPARSEDLSRLHWRLRRAISEGRGHSPGLFRFVCLLAEEWPKAVINWLCAGICKAPRFMRFPWLCRSGLSRARRHEKCVIVTVSGSSARAWHLRTPPRPTFISAESRRRAPRRDTTDASVHRAAVQSDGRAARTERSGGQTASKPRRINGSALARSLQAWGSLGPRPFRDGAGQQFATSDRRLTV